MPQADTQFPNANQRQNIPGANKPWSIRNAVRRLAAQTKDGKTRAEAIALKTLELAESGDMRAVEYVTDNVDGKLPQTNINAEFDRLKGMTDEELDAEFDRTRTELEALQAGDSERENFTSETDQPAAGEAPAVQPSAPAGEIQGS